MPALAAFGRDPLTAALAKLPGRAGCLIGGGTNRASCSRVRGAFRGYAASPAVSPDGRSVYVAGDAGVAVFARRGSRAGG